MDVVTPTKGRETPKTCTRKKEGCFPWDTLTDLDLGGSFSSTWMLILESPWCHHYDPGRHPELGFSFMREVVCLLACVASSRAFGGPTFYIWGPTFHLRSSMSSYKGMTSPLEVISVFNYFHLCKNWIFDVIWPSWPFYDLILIKGHWYCIFREKILSFYHHDSSHKWCGLKFGPL